MKSLVIGAAGFVGYYLIKKLNNEKEIVFATTLANENLDGELDCKTYKLDITNYQSVYDVLNEIKPDVIYHLAAQSSVKVSWDKPQLTANINIIGTINILEAVRFICPNARILLVGSGEEYGFIDSSEPINEDRVLKPQNLYALSKTTCESLGQIYKKAYGLDIKMTRSFNHIGPRQLPTFVVSDFCSQVAKIEKGLQEPTIRVGNLSAHRDFTDVRDIVDAYYLIVNNGVSGEVYNVGSGKAIQIQKILDTILSNSTSSITVEIDKNKFRPIDVPIVVPDVSKLKALSWSTKYDINESIKNILDSFRKQY